MSGFFDFSVIDTNFLTAGVTIITVGNATINANTHALSQMDKILFTKPTLKTVITSDMKQDIKSAIKNPNTMC
jgi:hypothetical protein